MQNWYFEASLIFLKYFFLNWLLYVSFVLFHAVFFVTSLPKIWFPRPKTHILESLAPPCLELIVTFIFLWCCISISSISSYLSFRPGGAAVSGFHLPFYCLHSLHFHTKVRSSRANMEKEKLTHFNGKLKIRFFRAHKDEV